MRCYPKRDRDWSLGCEGKHTKNQRQFFLLIYHRAAHGQNQTGKLANKNRTGCGPDPHNDLHVLVWIFSFMRWILLIVRGSLFLSVWSLCRKCPTLVPSIFITSDRSIISGPPTDDPKKRSFHISHFTKCGCETLFKAKCCGHFSDIFTVVGGGSRHQKTPTVFII